ncbi:MAG: ClbS/DfsB family four-helix bundle protein [Firmicutes bacterium]|nr:ClbS/DfsB family four-helix bundle protein [Bacillota bacterium]
MARATTKNDLLFSANEQYDKLWSLIDTIKIKTASI